MIRHSKDGVHVACNIPEVPSLLFYGPVSNEAMEAVKYIKHRVLQQHSEQGQIRLLMVGAFQGAALTHLQPASLLSFQCLPDK